MPRLQPLRLVIEGVDRLTRPIQKVSRRIERMREPVQRVRRSFQRLVRAARLDRIAMGARRVGREMGALARRVGFLGVALGTSLAVGLRQFVALGDSTVKTARKLGVGVEALQELRFAADRAGVEQRTFDLALQRFTRRTAEAAKGTGEAKDALSQMGIRLRDNNGRLRKAEDLFFDVADAMALVEDEGERVRLAFKLFDSEGVAVVNMLRDGSQGLRAAAREARILGAIMDEETSLRAERLADRFLDLRAVLKGVAFTAGAGLLPVVEELADKTLGWAKSNRELINVRVGDFARNLADDVRSAVVWLREAVPATVAVIRKFGGLTGVAAALAVVIGGRLVVALAELIRAIAFLKGALGIAAITSVVKRIREGKGVLGAILKLIRAVPGPLRVWLFALGAIAGLASVLLRRFEPVQQLFDGIGRALSTITEKVKIFWGSVRTISAEAGRLIATPTLPRPGTLAAAAGSPALAAPRLAASGADGSVQGLIRLLVESDRPTRVTEISSDGDVEIETEVSAGPTLITD